MPKIPHDCYIVYAPDYDKPDTFSRRLALREQHVKRGKEHVETGQIKVAGVMLTEDQEKMLGSVLFVKGESIEEVRKLIEEDIFYKENIWDKEKMLILPYHQGMGNIKLGG